MVVIGRVADAWPVLLGALVEFSWAAWWSGRYPVREAVTNASRATKLVALIAGGAAVRDVVTVAALSLTGSAVDLYFGIATFTLALLANTIAISAALAIPLIVEFRNRLLASAKSAALLDECRRERDELARASIELTTRLELLEAVFRQMPAGITVIDPDEHIVLRNTIREPSRDEPGPESALFLAGDAALGHFRRPDGHELPFEEWPLVRASREGCRCHEPELRLQRPDGTVVSVSTTAAPVLAPSGTKLGAVAVDRELSPGERVPGYAGRVDDRLGTALRAAGMYAWEWDLASGTVWRSHPPCGWDGIPPAPLHTKAEPDWSRVHPDDVGRYREAAAAVAAGHPDFLVEYRIRDARGEYRWVQERGKAVTDAAGTPVGRVAGVLIDVTEQRRNEERLRLVESAVVHARDAIIVLEPAPNDRPGRSVWYVNDAFTRMTGYSADEVVGRSLHFLRGPKSNPATLDQISEALATGHSLLVELLNYRKDGSELWVELSLVPVPDEAGRCSHWVMIQRDIGDRKRAAEQLRESEQRLRILGDNLPDGAVYQFVLAADGTPSVPYISAGVERVCGLSPAAVVADVSKVLNVIHPDDTEGMWRAVLASATGLTPCNVEFRATWGGAEKWVHSRSMPHRLADGGTLWNGVLLDVTARKQAEGALKRSEELFRGMFETAAAGVSVTGPDERFHSVNPAFAAMLGLPVEHIVGRYASEFTHPDDWAEQQPLLDEVHAGARDGYQVRRRYIRPDLSTVWTEQSVAIVRGPSGECVYGIGVSVDMTERRRLEEQLRQAQKMETIGQLAGGIAHDFNNLLTGVLGSLALVRLPADDPNRPLIMTAERAAQRAAELTRKLLGFARKNQILSAPVRVADFVNEVVDLLRRTFDPRIQIVTTLFAPDPVSADATLLNQALINLCLNARDAMPGGGRIVLRAEVVTLTPEAVVAHPEGRPGRFVRMSVEDTGTGMSPAVRARLYEPFFTTKPVGQGTGLGLAMVHGIVRQHVGWIECDTVPGRGTRFDLYLPVAEVKPPSAHNASFLRRATVDRTPAPNTDTPPPVGGPSRTVLLVDDEDMIRDIGRSVLEAAGYRVLEAEDGAAAVDVFRREYTGIDLVILDLTMPRLSGRDAFRSMTEIAPGARVLFSSGYSADDLSDVTGAVGLLAKPYRPQDLVSAVRLALRKDPMVVPTAG
ncbi:diguanylate cyclase/phosphodiesterase (GGDEF & EAL domains) with PAS/PAC sensor(s) [Fimbriiglobus ruber]|uniref:histidine kinase n=1 Tax=Fimbriiglobus ruber TaxID=1908690 RepID=A0A225D3Y4_9BACT|nr:diguanylate cyclase/phosphodiesterase (GGDEF & EAL domains) with PAS/PAC sensor(s) [Fimbriiglobus ruber]